MEQRENLTLLKFQLETEMFSMWDHVERDYVKRMETFSCDRINWHRRLPGILSDCSLGALYDSMPFLTWFKGLA